MWFDALQGYIRCSSPHSRGQRLRARRPRRQRSPNHKLAVELLENRSVPSAAPLPIPGGFANPFGGPFVHFNYPGPANAPPIHGNEPSTITNFKGWIGVADLTGTGKDGRGTTLYFEADMRFMYGRYQGTDGLLHEANFALVSLDLYPSLSDLQHKTNQLHAFNPGFGPAVNAAGARTFQTAAIHDGSVKQPINQSLSLDWEMEVNNLAVRDFTTVANSLRNGSSVAATVSFDAYWSPPTKGNSIQVTDATHGFKGTYIQDTATIEWSVSESGFTFTSNPASTSTIVFSEVGQEQNGIFFSTASGGGTGGGGGGGVTGGGGGLHGAVGHAGAAPASGRSNREAVALGQALGDSSPVVVPTGPSHPTSPHVRALALIPIGDQTNHHSSAPDRPTFGAAPTPPIEDVFTDLLGKTLPDTL